MTANCGPSRLVTGSLARGERAGGEVRGWSPTGAMKASSVGDLLGRPTPTFHQPAPTVSPSADAGRLWHMIRTLLKRNVVASVGTFEWRIAMTRFVGVALCVIAMCFAALSGRSMLERIDTTINHLGTANEQLQIANTQLTLANQRLADMQSQLGEANQRLDATEGHVKMANVQLREALTALTQTNAKMSAMNAKLGFIDNVVGKIPLLGPGDRPSAPRLNDSFADNERTLGQASREVDVEIGPE